MFTSLERILPVEYDAIVSLRNAFLPVRGVCKKSIKDDCAPLLPPDIFKW
jgi:hypothetical protein